MWWTRQPKIEFLCASEDFGAIARPVPANKIVPDWYRDIPQVDMEHFSADNTGITIKRCMPFLDAMSQGWIVCSPADIRVELSDNGAKAIANSLYPRNLISSHFGYQVKGASFENKVILKLETLWAARTPPGYSCLFVSPLNRSYGFTVLSGIIDTDKYYLQITPPFYFTRPDGAFTIEKGTPIAQIIPFRREAFKLVIRPPTKKEQLDTVRQSRGVFSETGWYRKYCRAKR